MTRTTRVQINALFFIALIIGQEASRPQFKAAMTVEMQAGGAQVGGKPRSKAENAFSAANNQCGYRWTQMACSGEGCKYRPLPLDYTYGQACRLSDDAMLKDTARFYPMQAELLLAKANKFSEQCQSLNFFNLKATMKCKRRAHHMMRALSFTNKAELLNKTASVPRAEFKTAGKAMDESLKIMSGAVGEGGPSVLKLLDKVKKSAALREDAHGTLKKSTKILWDLLMGNDADKKQAHEAMDGLIEADANATWHVPKPDAAEEKTEVEDIETLVKSIEKLDEEGKGSGSSLIQQMESSSLQDNEKTLKQYIFAITVFTVVCLLLYFAVAQYMIFLGGEAVAAAAQEGASKALGSTFAASLKPLAQKGLQTLWQWGPVQMFVHSVLLTTLMAIPGVRRARKKAGIPRTPGCYFKQLNTSAWCGSEKLKWTKDTWGLSNEESWLSTEHCLAREAQYARACNVATEWLFISPPPGCYYYWTLPSEKCGAPKEWVKDEWGLFHGESFQSELKCYARKAAMDKECGVKTTWLYIPTDPSDLGAHWHDTE